MAFRFITTADVLARLSGYPRDLTWIDFRKVQHSLKPPFQALTSSGYSRAGFSTRLVDGTYRPVFSGRHVVTVTLDGRSTWVLSDPAAQTADLLRHEQGHFDITGIIARDLCRDLLTLELDSSIAESVTELVPGRPLPRNLTPAQLLQAAHAYIQSEVSRFDREAADLLDRLQSHRDGGVVVDGEYDKDSKHGMDGPGQRKWNDILRQAREHDTSLALTREIFTP